MVGRVWRHVSQRVGSQFSGGWFIPNFASDTLETCRHNAVPRTSPCPHRRRRGISLAGPNRPRGDDAHEAGQFARPAGRRLLAGARRARRRVGERLRRLPRISAPVPLVRLRRRRFILRDLRVHHRPYASRVIRKHPSDPRISVPEVLARLPAVLDHDVDRRTGHRRGAQPNSLPGLVRVAHAHAVRVPQLLHRPRVDADVRGRVLRRLRAALGAPAALGPVGAGRLGRRDCGRAVPTKRSPVLRGDGRGDSFQPADLGILARLRGGGCRATLPPARGSARGPRRHRLGNLLGGVIFGTRSSIRFVHPAAGASLVVRPRLGADRLRVHRGGAAGDFDLAEVATGDGRCVVFHLPLARPHRHVAALQRAVVAAPHGPALGMVGVHAVSHLGRRDAAAPLGRTAAVEPREAPAEDTRTGDRRSPRVT